MSRQAGCHFALCLYQTGLGLSAVSAHGCGDTGRCDRQRAAVRSLGRSQPLLSNTADILDNPLPRRVTADIFHYLTLYVEFTPREVVK